MPTIQISSETHKAMKEYLVDIEGYDQDEFIEDCVAYVMENLSDFEENYGPEEEEEEPESED